MRRSQIVWNQVKWLMPQASISISRKFSAKPRRLLVRRFWTSVRGFWGKDGGG